MVTATALLVAFPFLPFVLPKRIARSVGVVAMAACVFSGLAFAWAP